MEYLKKSGLIGGGSDNLAGKVNLLKLGLCLTFFSSECGVASMGSPVIELIRERGDTGSCAQLSGLVGCCSVTGVVTADVGSLRGIVLRFCLATVSVVDFPIDWVHVLEKVGTGWLISSAAFQIGQEDRPE